jgi:hypothetical protein
MCQYMSWTTWEGVKGWLGSGETPSDQLRLFDADARGHHRVRVGLPPIGLLTRLTSLPSSDSSLASCIRYAATIRSDLR